MQLNLSGFILGDDAGILEIDEVSALESLQCRHHLARAVLIGVDDCNKVCHVCLLPVGWSLVRRSPAMSSSKYVCEFAARSQEPGGYVR
jgi:hypothetical protein